MKDVKHGRTTALAVVIIILTAIVVYQYILLQDKKKGDDMNMENNNHTRFLVEVTDSHQNIQRFTLGEPVSVSREVLFTPQTKTPNAFYLPAIGAKTVEFEGQFIGDVNRGGSCNVDVLSYVPHGITHMETSAHILSKDSNPPYVNDIPRRQLNGIVYLIDLTQPAEGSNPGAVLGDKPGQTIPWEIIEKKLKSNTLPISMLALKTKGSLLPQDYDFSGKDFLAVSPEAAKGIHDYGIDCLLLDLPSIDPESDGGKLLAHRAFFGLPETGVHAQDREKRALVELAWFANLEEGYYYASITPPPFQANAVTTGIVFHPLTTIDK
jgi:kynurenine formamidase